MTQLVSRGRIALQEAVVRIAEVVQAVVEHRGHLGADLLVARRLALNDGSQLHGIVDGEALALRVGPIEPRRLGLELVEHHAHYRLGRGIVADLVRFREQEAFHAVRARVGQEVVVGRVCAGIRRSGRERVRRDVILGEGCHALGNGLERAAFGDGERVRHRTGRQLVDDGVERHTARECVGTGLELGINAHLVDALREVSRIGNQTGFRKLLSDDLGTSTFGHRDRGLLTLGQKLDRLRGTAVEQGERAPRQTSDDENGQNGGDYSRSLAFLRADIAGIVRTELALAPGMSRASCMVRTLRIGDLLPVLGHGTDPLLPSSLTARVKPRLQKQTCGYHIYFAAHGLLGHALFTQTPFGFLRT